MTIYRSKVVLGEMPRKSIWDYLFEDVSFDDDRPAFKECNERGRSISLGQVKLEAQRLGHGLRSKGGLKQGDTVLFILPSTIDFIIAVFATQFAGLKASFANPSYARSEMQHVYNLLQPSRIFTTSALLNTVSKAGLPWNKCIIMDTEVGNSTISRQSLLATEEEAKQASPAAISDLNETAYLPWSSGTTGLPKAVDISHANVVSMLSMFVALPRIFDSPKRMITCLPFFHAYGLIKSVHLTISLQGSSTFILPSFNAIKMIEVIQKEKIQVVPTVPPMLLAFLNLPQTESWSSVEHIGCGAAPLDSKLQSQAEERFGAPVLQGYGMSETTVTATGNQYDIQHGTVGRLMPGLEARLVDDDGVDVALGERGELLLKGPTITRGYYKNPEATRDTFTSDGWMRTGDIAMVDGRTDELSIVDRKKELIKVKGFQVAPAELEAILIQHPKVALAAVVGVYDKSQATEYPRAYIQLMANLTRSDAIGEEIIAYVKAKTSHHKQLKGGVRIIDAVPVSASGKILRKQVRTLAREEEEQEMRGGGR